MIEQNSTHTVQVLGSVSTARNTGQHGHVGALIEKKLGRPGQRVLCSKHIIETLWNKIPDLSPEVVKNLNHFTKAVPTGPSYFVEHPKPRTILPGHMHNARWIKLYFGTEKPSKDLVKLIKFLTEF